MTATNHALHLAHVERAEAHRAYVTADARYMAAFNAAYTSASNDAPGARALGLAFAEAVHAKHAAALRLSAAHASIITAASL